MRQSRKRPPFSFRNHRVEFRVSANVQFVKDGAIPGNLVPGGFLNPFKRWIDYDALRHERSAVALIETQIRLLRTYRVAEQGRVPLQFPKMGACIRIEQQFVRVEPVTFFGRVWSVYPVTVQGSRADVGDIAMPDFVAVFGKFDALNLSLSFFIEQTKLYFARIGGKEREVHPCTVPGRAPRERLA